MRGIKRMWVGLLAFALVLAACLEPKPEGTVREFLEGFRAVDAERMQKCVVAQEGVELQTDMGMTEATPEQMEILRRLFSRCSYKIGQVTTQEDTASVAVTLTCVDMTEVLKELIGELFGSLMMSAAMGQEPDEAEMMAIVMDELAEIVEDPDVKMSTADITFNLEKHDNTWLIVLDKRTSQEFLKALFGELAEFLNSVESDMT